MKDTLVLWFTGLSGSGKTTIANVLSEELRMKSKTVMIIDGDVVRNTVHKNLNFTPEDISENNRKIAMMCYDNLGLYDFILVPIISPFREDRSYARELLSYHFVEVYIMADIEECIKRDVKGLYKRALSGLINNFIGISQETPYEEPLCPDICLDTKKEKINYSVSKILEYLIKINHNIK